MKYYLGVDLGGTNARVAKVDEDGNICAMVKSPSDGMAGVDEVLKTVFNLIKSIPDWDKCEGIGVGVPGPVQTDTGTMTISTNLKGFAGLPLKKILEDELKIPAYIDNDANVAGLAEAVVGAGKGDPIVYYATISTGIGGALVVNGKVVSGYKGFAGEIGNIIVDRNRPDRNLGLNKGALEPEAGGRALTLRAQEIWGEDKIKHAGDFFQLVVDKDPKAMEMLETFTEDLAIIFAAIAHVVDPRCFILGGGMLKSKDVWLEKFKEKFYSRLHAGMRETEIRLVKLEEPGLVGAAMLPRSFGK